MLLTADQVSDFLIQAVEVIRAMDPTETFTQEDAYTLADRIAVIHDQLIEEGEMFSGDYTTYSPVLDQLNEDLAVFRVKVPAPVDPAEEEKMHIIIDRKHWESMDRPGQISVPVLPYEKPE